MGRRTRSTSFAWESIVEQHGNDDLASVITRLPRRSSGDAGSTEKFAA